MLLAFRQSVRLSILKQVQDLATFKIDQYGAVFLTLSHDPIIHAEDS
jgi:hypothetical protein